MTRVAIIGGKLQGIEAAYLANKAGIETLLIDKAKSPPASGLCNDFFICDVLLKEKELIEQLKGVDFILPAIENHEVLTALNELSQEFNFNLAFDLNAYTISSSKLLSDQLIHNNQIPAPRYYPECKAPYIVKPSSFSGSTGVRRIETKEEMETFLKAVPAEEKWVAQEFLTGPSYSIEIIGKPDNYRTYEVTQIHMDEVYDCKKVTSPCEITKEQRKAFEDMAFKLANMVGLNGIMDVEVIDDEGEFKVLEIDARIPSQTPTVVFYTSGMNLVEELKDLYCHGEFRSEYKKQKKYTSFEHLLIKEGKVTEHGEHIMGEAGPLRLRKNFFGADEVLSDYVDGLHQWRGTFINWADSRELLEQKRENMMRQLSRLNY